MHIKVRTRFAPSPTGFVHLGSMYTALFEYVAAKSLSGTFVVRIEDTDQSRLVDGAEEAIFSGLDWLGIVPDESPHHGGEFGPYRQSERLDIYQTHIRTLIDSGHAYYAFETPEELAAMRKDQESRGEMPKYDRASLRFSEKEIEERISRKDSYVIRMKVPDDRRITFLDGLRGEIAIDSKSLDDQVLIKSDGFPTYHFAVVVDDYLMQISHVLRAEEWISSTPKHVLLYEMFGWDLPIFAHFPLIRDESRGKLSKRHGHAGITWYQEEGFLPEAVINYLALQGWSHPEGKDIFKLNEFISLFSLERMVTSSPMADLDKLTWINGHYIRALSPELFAEELIKFDEKWREIDQGYLRSVIVIEQERTHTLKEFSVNAGFFFAHELHHSEDLLVQKNKTREVTISLLNDCLSLAESIDPWVIENLETKFESLVAEKTEWTKKDIYMTLRGAVSAQSATPPLFEMFNVLGQSRLIDRINSAIDFLKRA